MNQDLMEELSWMLFMCFISVHEILAKLSQQRKYRQYAAMCMT